VTVQISVTSDINDEAFLNRADFLRWKVPSAC